MITASRMARPQWDSLVRNSPGAAGSIHGRIIAGEQLFRDTFVRAFMDGWREKLGWDVIYQGSNGYQLALPFGLAGTLMASSNITSVSFYLSDLRQEACAQLGTNDHNQDTGLTLNAPAWIPIATNASCVAMFERQLRMVVHHEMAHFKWHKDPARDEYLAHARGVAALRDTEWPKAKTEIIELLQREHPEAWGNEEIKNMVYTRDWYRHLRFWGWRRRQTLGLI